MIVDPDFPDHWKTRMLIGLLGDDQTAPLYVIRLWAHCQNRRQTEFDLLPEALKALCHFPGNANKLESSLVTSGFIRRTENVVSVLNWSEKNRQLTASWSNGAKGGKPKKTRKQVKTKPIPRDETHGLPTGNPQVTHGEPNPSSLLSSYSFPEGMKTPEAENALSEWLEYKLERKEVYKSARSVEALLKRFAKIGPERFSAAVRYSISQDWRGVYEEKTGVTGPKGMGFGASEDPRGNLAARDRALEKLKESGDGESEFGG